MNSSAGQFVAFTVAGQSFAMPLASVDRVVRMVEVTALPGGPEIVTGVIDLQGCVIPVFDIRKRFSLPPSPIKPSDQLIVVRTSARSISIPVDSVTGLITPKLGDVTHSEQFAPGNPYVIGATQVSGELTLIYDLEKFLSIDEESILDDALGED